MDGPNDVELEDGELSDSGDEVYTPLQRPGSSNVEAINPSPLATCHQIQTALDEDESQEDCSDSSSGESSEGCIKKIRTDQQSTQAGQRKRKKRIRRTVMVRIPQTDATAQQSRTRFKKYNIWTAALQEDALTETMRGCDVTRSELNDRNVENYDFPNKYMFNGGNSLKRRLSNSTDDEWHPANKRGRPSIHEENECKPRRPFKNRSWHKSRGRSGQQGTTSTSASSDNSCEARHIQDLDETIDRDPLDVAREIANKLHEHNDSLLVHVVKTLGIELPIEVYKETQRIEADGGMMIKNGKRRRTPGGVFLFLLKHHDHLSPEQVKSIFKDQKQIFNKSRKQIESIMRDRKVEELKKRLSEQGNELPAANPLSNPPPSPVGHDQSSPEYKAHAINHVASDAADAPSTSAFALAAATSEVVTDAPKPSTEVKELISYDNDFLEVHYRDMDFF